MRVVFLSLFADRPSKANCMIDAVYCGKSKLIIAYLFLIVISYNMISEPSCCMVRYACSSIIAFSARMLSHRCRTWTCTNHQSPWITSIFRLQLLAQEPIRNTYQHWRLRAPRMNVIFWPPSRQSTCSLNIACTSAQKEITAFDMLDREPLSNAYGWSIAEKTCQFDKDILTRSQCSKCHIRALLA